jgi:hypothetical protein
MRRWIIVAAALFIGLALAVPAIRGDQPKGGTRGAAGAALVGADLQKLRQARVEAARDVVAELEKRMEAGEAVTPTFIDLLAESRKRLAEAEVAAAAGQRDRIAAAQRYVERSRETLDLVQARFQAGVDVSRVQVSQAKYRLADAECTLAELRAQ